MAYEPFNDHLRFYGYEVEYADLPSIGRREGLPPATLTDDAAHVREVVQKLFDADKSVVLVAHSYGGMPATECLKGLTAKERGPGKPAVERVIYTTAITPAVGSSLQSLLADLEASYIEVLVGSTPDIHSLR
jgi:alpha-beta hydrolase superfamily lysophospholipase